jgi:hypothetical protein
MYVVAPVIFYDWYPAVFRAVIFMASKESRKGIGDH